MKKIIAVAGQASTGRTNTIQLVYERMAEKFPQFEFHPTFPRLEPNAVGDFRVIVQINHKLIGLESHRHPGSRISKTLPAFVNLACDLIVCTTTLRGASAVLVESYKRQYRISRIEKKRARTALEQYYQDDEIANKILHDISLLVN